MNLVRLMGILKVIEMLLVGCLYVINEDSIGFIAYGIISLILIVFLAYLDFKVLGLGKC